MTTATNLILSLFFTVHLQWNANADCVDGYRVYRGSSATLQAPVYSEVEDVRLTLEHFADVPANQYNYFAVTAYRDGIESDLGTPQVWVYFQRD